MEFGIRGEIANVIMHTKFFCQSVEGLQSSDAPKIAISHRLVRRCYNSVCTTVRAVVIVLIIVWMWSDNGKIEHKIHPSIWGSDSSSGRWHFSCPGTFSSFNWMPFMMPPNRSRLKEKHSFLDKCRGITLTCLTVIIVVLLQYCINT